MKSARFRLLAIALATVSVPALHAQEPAAQAQEKPKTDPAKPATLGETVVEGDGPRGAYGTPATTSITGLPSPIEELPLTVNTISERFIEDTSARRIRDLVGYVPGVYAGEDSGGTGDLVNIRGFDFIYQSYINGMRNRVSYNASRRFANIERIEIFKGPGGVEFGVGEPGGFVNYVTKKPQATQSTTLGFEAGSYDYIHGFIDSTGPLGNAPSGDGDLGTFYRLIVSGDSANSFRDAFHTDGYQIAPSILWKYAEDSSVLVEFDYQYRDQPYDRGVMYLKGAGFKDDFTPINTSYHEPDDYFDNHNTRTSVYWNHKIDDTFSLRLTGELDYNRAMGNGVRNPYTYLLYKGPGDPGPWLNEWNGNPTLARVTHDFDQELYSFGLKPELLVNFETGSVKHAGLFGVNYLYTDTYSRTIDGYDYRPINIFGPIYGQPPQAPPVGLPKRNFRYSEELQELGFYYEHKADINDRVHLLGGVRYDWYDIASAAVRNVTVNPLPPLSGFSDGNVSARLGGVVDVTENVSLFAGVSNSFQPQSGILPDGDSPDALEATSVEFGVKANFCDDRLLTTLSFYDTQRKNMLEADPTDPDGNFVIPLGTVKVRGVEFEATGKLTEDLDVQGGFALMDSEISDTMDLTTYGKNFYNVPDFQAGLRLRYDTGRWLVKGLSVGAGAIYVDERNGDAQNTFVLPDYVRFDAGIYYAWRNWNFKLTCENLADETYYLASQGVADIIQPGSPRLFTLGATVTF